MAKYEWFNVEKTKLKLNLNEDGLWREIDLNDVDYIVWAAQEGNTVETPLHIQAAIDLIDTEPTE